ncbi:MAG: hypothetical protein R3F33_11170 [Planctomycetota bacterium]
MSIIVLNPGTGTVDYGVSTARVEVIEGATKSPFFAIVGIEPTRITKLPQFDIRLPGGARQNLDVYPHKWYRDRVVALLLRGTIDHPATTGVASREVEVEIVQRNPGDPIGTSLEQWIEPAGLGDLTLETFLPRGIGAVSTQLFAQEKKAINGIWRKETRHYARMEYQDPGNGETRPVFGVQTFVHRHSAADCLVFTVYVHNDLFNIDYPGGVFEVNDKTGGHCYFKWLKIGNIPAGWTIEQYDCNSTTQGGEFLVKEEGAAVSYSGGEYSPSPEKHPVEDSWHVLASRACIRRRFVLRKTATCTQGVAQQIYRGAGLSRVESGELADWRRGRNFGPGWRRMDIPDSYVYQTVSGREGMRLQIAQEWQHTLNAIASGSGYSCGEMARMGYLYYPGKAQGRTGGGYELHPFTGCYRFREEYQAMQFELDGKIPRHAVGTTQWDTGDILTADQWADANNGRLPFLCQINFHSYGRWNYHYRPDEVPDPSTLPEGNTDPGIQFRSDDDESDRHKSLMPQGYLHNAPGAGKHTIEYFIVFPFHTNEGYFTPYEGSHHLRWTRVYEGLADLTGDEEFRYLAFREAEHVRQCLSEHVPDSGLIPYPAPPLANPGGRGEFMGFFYRYEVNIPVCIDSFENHPFARKHHGSHGERRPNWPPMVNGQPNFNELENLGPRWFHRLWSEAGIAVPIAGGLHGPCEQWDNWKRWQDSATYLMHLRASKDGFGYRSYYDDDDQTVPLRPYNLGISIPSTSMERTGARERRPIVLRYVQRVSGSLLPPRSLGWAICPVKTPKAGSESLPERLRSFSGSQPSEIASCRAHTRWSPVMLRLVCTLLINNRMGRTKGLAMDWKWCLGTLDAPRRASALSFRNLPSFCNSGNPPLKQPLGARLRCGGLL